VRHRSLGPVGSPLSEAGRFDDPEHENVATVDQLRSFSRSEYALLPTGMQPPNRRTAQEHFEESDDSEDRSFVSADEFFSAEEDTPPISRRPENRPSGSTRSPAPPSRQDINCSSYPTGPRNGRGGRSGGGHRGSPRAAARASRARPPLERTIHNCSIDRQDRPIPYVPLEHQSAPSRPHHRAPPPPAQTGSPVGQQTTRKPEPRTKGKHKVTESRSRVREGFADVLQDEQWNQQVGIGDASDFSTPVTKFQKRKGKDSQTQPADACGVERSQTPRIEKPPQQLRNTRQSGTGRGSKPNRYHSTDTPQASQQSSRESSFNRQSSFGVSPSTAPTSAQSSFSHPEPSPSRPKCHKTITGSGYYSDVSTEPDEGPERLEAMSRLPRSEIYPAAARPSQKAAGVVVEESNMEADEEALLEHLREEAERERLMNSFDELPSEDQYDVSDALAHEMAKLDLDSVLAEASQSETRRPFETFKYLLQHEVTRVSLALGLSPEECETRVPIIAENCGQAFHNAQTRKELWDAMKLFAQQLSTGKPMPEPLPDDVWLTLNGSTSWSNVVELTGVASLDLKAKGFNLNIRLNPPSIKGKGHKFAYRFGSDRFLTLKISTNSFRAKQKDRSVEEEIRSQMARWLMVKELRLINRCWRCFYVKGGNKKKRKEADQEDTSPESLNPEKTGASTTENFLWAYFFAESGIGLGEPSYRVQGQLGFLNDAKTGQDEMIRTEMSRDDLIRWHMPIDKHMDNTFAKIWSRISLGISSHLPFAVF